MSIYKFLFGVIIMESGTNHKVVDLKKVKLALDSLSIYRKLLEDELINKLYSLLNYSTSDNINAYEFINIYNDFFFTLATTSKMSLKEYLIEKIIFDENPYSLAANNTCLSSKINLLATAVSNDLLNLQIVTLSNSSMIKNYLEKHMESDRFDLNLIEKLPDWGLEGSDTKELTSELNHIKLIKEKFKKSLAWNECLHELTQFYSKHGCGIFAGNIAFTWKHKENKGYLKGVENLDPVKMTSFIGYDYERTRIIENTNQFLNNYPANNVLLYGDRGTGKSSTVKALLNEYYMEGLRMIEVPKAFLSDFSSIISSLNGRRQKFIIFIDDLALEDKEDNYTALKAVLEGSLESKPSNVLIYATSNRRHLIKEYFHERSGIKSSGNSDEVHSTDSIQEKLSLADRFGITVTFTSPDQRKYLEIVDGLVERMTLKIDKEEVHKEAIKWEIRYNGRSARGARQFVDWLAGNEGVKSNSIKEIN